MLQTLLIRPFVSYVSLVVILGAASGAVASTDRHKTVELGTSFEFPR